MTICQFGKCTNARMKWKSKTPPIWRRRITEMQMREERGEKKQSVCRKIKWFNLARNGCFRKRRKRPRGQRVGCSPQTHRFFEMFKSNFARICRVHCSNSGCRLDDDPNHPHQTFEADVMVPCVLLTTPQSVDRLQTPEDFHEKPIHPPTHPLSLPLSFSLSLLIAILSPLSLSHTFNLTHSLLINFYWVQVHVC